MHSFTEYYRLRWFALNIADGDFSYLWYGGRFTESLKHRTCMKPDEWRPE